ncbi:MAG: hypothetical protein ACREFC_02560 [Stellaceae bacterium]
MIARALVALVLSLAAAGPAIARPPANPNPALVPWYESLRRPDGNHGPCCSVSDCRNVTARTTRTGYQVLIGGGWTDVPRTAVLNVSNPTGKPVACWVRSPEKGALVTTIICFVPGPMS